MCDARSSRGSPPFSPLPTRALEPRPERVQRGAASRGKTRQSDAARLCLPVLACLACVPACLPACSTRPSVRPTDLTNNRPTARATLRSRDLERALSFIHKRLLLFFNLASLVTQSSTSVLALDILSMASYWTARISLLRYLKKSVACNSRYGIDCNIREVRVVKFYRAALLNFFFLFKNFFFVFIFNREWSEVAYRRVVVRYSDILVGNK